MPHGEFAHVAVDQIEAEREDDIDADVHEDELHVRIEKLERGDGEGEDEADCQQAEARQRECISGAAGRDVAADRQVVHTFCGCGLPRIP